MALENSGRNYGVLSETINGSVHIYNSIDNKKRLHSLMPRFIEILAKNVIINSPEASNCIPPSYKIEDKIKHNRLIKYKYLVDDYGNYYLICENSFKSLENIVDYPKERILGSVSEKYKAEKRLLLGSNNQQQISEIDLIRNNADDIIDKIGVTIREEIMLNYNEEHIFQEDVDFCLPVFLCYAFVECKILERP